MLSVENEVLDVEGLNPEENAKDGHGHSLNNGSEVTSKFTPQAQLESRGCRLLRVYVSIIPRHILFGLGLRTTELGASKNVIADLFCVINSIHRV